MATECKKPYITAAGLAFGCGHCAPCEIKKREVWVTKLMLEGTQHQEAVFVTLTYDENNVPLTEDGIPTLRRNDLVLFHKRLRKAVEPLKLRNFNRSEYGETTDRPHYHTLIFNYPNCLQGSTNTTQMHETGSCCPPCDQIRATWGLGNIVVQPFCEQNARYVAKYSTKNLRQKDNPDLNGREPEKTWGSNKPGLGTEFLDDFASAIMEHHLDELGDVPKGVRVGKKIHPLGPTLTRKLRVKVGKEPNAPPEELLRMVEELRPIKEKAFASATPGNKYFEFQSVLIDQGEGRRIQLAAKTRKGKGKL
ncbi:MAG TPA: hypothetical protein V6C97_27320 [Oculatellaceae cyanobacterium]